MTGSEELDAAIGDDDYFGFGVDAGWLCGGHPDPGGL